MDSSVQTSQDTEKKDTDENGSLQTIASNEEVEMIAQRSVKKPKRTRALVYQFFEWNEKSGQYECKLCEKYVYFN